MNETFVVRCLHGLSCGKLLFLVTSGLILVFGGMTLLSMAYVSFFMPGAHFPYQMLRWGGNFWIGLVTCAIPGSFAETTSSVRAQVTDEVIRRINLDREGDMPASVLSYRKYRSLEISMALATDPDLIMLDEPTAGMSRMKGLAPLLVKEGYDILEGIHRVGVSMLLVANSFKK